MGNLLVSSELNFWPPLADMVKHHASLGDVRNKPGFWRAAGIFPAPSGFNWGSIYHGTPFPAAAAIALARPGRMGEGLGRAMRPESVYVVVPTAFGGARGETAEVTRTFKRLWQEKVVFGVFQEDCLDNLPKTARVLICPRGVTADSTNRVEELRKSGVQVFMGLTEDWQKAVNISRLSVTPGEGINLLTRRTVTGTLYSLMGTGPAKPVSVETEQKTNVRLGLNAYVMVHEGASGVNLVEATGEIAINGAHFCTIERGRAIIASDDGQGLVQSNRLRVLATEPTRIKFARPVHSLTVLQENGAGPLATFTPEAADNSAVAIDSELVRYIVRVEFEK